MTGELMPAIARSLIAAILVSGVYMTVTMVVVRWVVSGNRARARLWLMSLGCMTIARLLAIAPWGRAHPGTAFLEVSRAAGLGWSMAELVPTPSLPLANVLVIGLGVGVMVKLGLLAWQIIRSEWRAAMLRRNAPGAAEFLESEWSRLGVERTPIRVVPDLTSATVYGVLRPVVVLPTGWVNELAPEELCAILAHEAAHIRSHDERTHALANALGCLLLADPAALIALRELDVAREIACDDAVHRSGQFSRFRYGRLLLRLSDSLSSSARATLQFSRSHSSVCRRVEALASGPVNSVSGRTIHSMVGTMMAGVILAGTALVSAAAEPLLSKSLPHLNGVCVVNAEEVERLVPGKGLLSVDDIGPGMAVPCIGGGTAFARRVSEKEALAMIQDTPLQHFPTE